MFMKTWMERKTKGAFDLTTGESQELLIHDSADRDSHLGGSPLQSTDIICSTSQIMFSFILITLIY